MHEQRELRATLMTIGASVLVWAVQQLIQQNMVEGVLGLGAGVAALWAYEHVVWLHDQEVAGQVAELLDGVDDEDVKDAVEEFADQIQDSGGLPSGLPKLR